MPLEVRMPQMGESIAEGTLVRWLKSVGDTVSRDEPLFEISTDKVDTEIPAEADGVLEEIRVKEGETVAVDSIVALLATTGDGGAAKADSTTADSTTADSTTADSTTADSTTADSTTADTTAGSAVSTKEPPAPPSGTVGSAARSAADLAGSAAGTLDSPGPGQTVSAAATIAPARPETISTATASESTNDRRHRSSPLVRRIAREHGIDLDDVRGSGSGGRVTKKDILSHIERGSQPATMTPTGSSTGVAAAADAATATTMATATAAAAIPAHSFSGDEVRVEAMSTMRLKIAEHMVASKFTAPHVTTVHEVDMTEVARKIAAHKENFLRINGTKLTYLPFIMKAVVSGVREFPVVNACMVGKDIHYFKRVNIGIAVAVAGVDGRSSGLMVPVVRDADEKSILGHARAISDLAGRARSKKIQLEELTGGTFTISNYGVFGSVLATPVINQPQAAILGIGAVVKRPVVLAESDAIAVRSMSYLSLSFDHRIIDGAVADQFLAHVKEILERCPYDPMES